MPELERELAAGCRALELAVTDAQRAQLLAYLELLQKWNKAYNLTAIRDPQQMVVKHLLDSLAVVPHITGSCLADVGTGAGLPGIPLAIIYPEREFHLIDSNGKKTRFLFQVKTALGLANMTVHHRRVEAAWEGPEFDAVISRAFASLADMVAGCRHMLRPGGQFLAMKGAYPHAELAALGDDYHLLAATALQVPGLDEQRHLLALSVNNE